MNNHDIAMAKPQVTVLIPFYNKGAYLIDAISSVFAQTYQNWKLIIIDDGSSDDTNTLINNFLSDPRVTLIKNSKNHGQSKTLNIGLAITDTPWVITLDSDDWFYPHTLSDLINEAQLVSDRIGLIHGNLTACFEEDGKITREVPVKGQPVTDRYQFILNYKGICPRFYRTSALKSIGGFPFDDPYDGRHIEDLPVLLKLIEKYQFHYVDKYLYYYRQHGGMETNKRKLVTDKMKWVIKKALERWGNIYEPIFETIDDDWIKVKELKQK